jgi:hypothetical protein
MELDLPTHQNWIHWIGSMMIPTNLSRPIRKECFPKLKNKSLRHQLATVESLVKTVRLLMDQTQLTKIMPSLNGLSSAKPHQLIWHKWKKKNAKCGLSSCGTD